MAPGYVLDQVGVALLEVPGLRLLGFILLTLGVALFAAGMSSVKAIRLSMRLRQSPGPSPLASQAPPGVA